MLRVGLATTSLLGAGVGLAVVRPAASAAAESRIGVHSMLYLNSPPSFMRAMFAEAVALHASAIRLDVAPSLIFTSPSQPADYAALDEVTALSQEFHLRVIADLFTIPWWIANCPGPTSFQQMGLCGTDDLAGYGARIGQIVAHADGLIHDWEIWNEPENGGSFTGTPQQYALMLRAAHDAVTQADPQANVLLGGMSSTSSMTWLAQVFATPGADAAHAFDIASIHLRDRLDALGADVAAWRQFLAGYGFSGPVWVTEHGYPSDPAFQSDPAYAGGAGSQSAYLSASIATLLEAGAGEVLVTERDNLGGAFASEGLLGGGVSDPPVANPQLVEKPAYAGVQALAGCYQALGRDCPGPPPAASPAALAIPATPLGSSGVASVSVSDPGPQPVQLGTVTLPGANAASLALQRDTCSHQLLEPDQTCTTTLRFTPVAGGAAAATMQLPSDNGTLRVPVNLVTPSVSSLVSSQPPAFIPAGVGDGGRRRQRLVLSLTNPLTTAVYVARSTLTGVDVARFAIASDRCAGAQLAPAAGCGLTVLFSPRRAGTARATLTLRGDGAPLSIALHATALALPTVTVLAVAAPGRCLGPAPRNRLLALTDQPASVYWVLARAGHAPDSRCPASLQNGGAPGTRWLSAASGRASTGRQWIQARGSGGYVVRPALPIGAGPRRLRPGSYLLTVRATDANGTGRPRSMWLTVPG